MDAQELRNLQEAYLEVYQLDEAKEDDGMSYYVKRQTRNDRIRSQVSPVDPENNTEPGLENIRRSAHISNRGKKKTKAFSYDTLTGGEGKFKRSGKYGAMQRRGMSTSDQFRKEVLKRKMNEEYDIYDIILSHLLDEGFASDEKSAEVIMGAMSEAWIGSIVEEVLDEAVLGARKGHIRSVIGKGGSEIKYVASGGDIFANDRSAQARASAAERKRAGKNKVRTAQFQQANKKSIERLNSKPGEDSGDYNDGDYGDDDTSNGKRYYKLSHTNRAARRRRETGR